MIRRLIILLLVVGCEANKGNKPNSSEPQLFYKEKIEQTYSTTSASESRNVCTRIFFAS